MNKKILIIDDDIDVQVALKTFFTSQQYDAEAFGDAESAYAYLENAKAPNLTENGLPCDLIVCDLKLPGMDGIEFLERVTRAFPFVPVILLTAHGAQENAALAMNRGAFDYITKPVNFTELSVIATRAIKISNLEIKFKKLNTHIDYDRTQSFGRMIAKSKVMQDIFGLARKIAPTSSSVMVTGESGTGKEMLADAIHQASDRATGPFVAVNCSAIPNELLESELFGHKKGSFTGATESRQGLFMEANGGTIFLDEIGDMPPSLQSKLLRVLQERKIRPVGDNKSLDIDVRIISATHRDLKKMIDKGTFREDLYYRLCVIPICIPPLRERREDILILANLFLEKYAAKNKLNVKSFSRKAVARLYQLKWCGNVRELENTIERAVILSQGSVVDEQHILIESTANDDKKIYEHFSSHLTLRALEKEYIKHILVSVEDKKERAAQILGIDRKTLYRKEKEYKISAHH
jgi:two-component system, NtrC family, response regulator HydG